MTLRHLAVASLLFASAPQLARAQEEFAPPSGNGRIVMVLSGISGPSHYRPVARVIAQQGYDVLLYDSNTMSGTHGAALKTAVAEAPQHATHALPGKIGLVGFSLGGGMALGYAPGWSDTVAAVVTWYPATRDIMNVHGWAARIAMPTLVLAGEADDFRNGCCVIAKARELAAAAANNTAFQLISYPGAEHDFVIGGEHYDAKAYEDAMQRTVATLKQALGN